MVKISVITPSVRPELLEMVKKCLDRQTMKEFEWIVVSPFEYKYAIWVQDPPKQEGDMYSLNKAWNAGFRKAEGELFVSIVDGLWFPPDTLEKLWDHYVSNPLACIGGIGHQYDQMENGKPEHKVWSDPRVRPVTFYPISPMDLELCIASISMQGIKDVGGVEERFDRFAALSEKEMCFRLKELGYQFFIDQSIEYRAIQHPRLTKDWDQRYQKGIIYFNECIQNIKDGNRLTLPYLRDTLEENEVSEKEPATQ